mgnify:CR=1 FL=1
MYSNDGQIRDIIIHIGEGTRRQAGKQAGRREDDGKRALSMIQRVSESCRGISKFADNNDRRCIDFSGLYIIIKYWNLTAAIFQG